MIQSDYLKKLIDFAFDAYQNHTINGEEYRQNGNVPYFFHPTWCASILLTDTRIPYEERELGYQVLILHDVLENTDVDLPDWVSAEVKSEVQEMTYESYAEAIEKLPNKTPFRKLLSLVDLLASMYEEHVKEKNRSIWMKFTKMLTEDVEKHYGNIRIVQLSKTIVANTDWKIVENN